MPTSHQPSAASDDADLGILDADADAHSHQHSETNDASEGPVTMTREDVYGALTNATHKGSFAAGDRADGSTTTPALPTAPGLRVTGISDVISFPVCSALAKAIKSKGQKVKDASYHGVFEVDRSKIRLENPAWSPSLEKVIDTVAYKLGVPPSCLTAELDRLLLMGKGSRIDRCLNADEGPDVLGTLFVALPSKFTGGEVIVSCGAEDEHNEDDIYGDDEGGEETMRFNFASTSPFACHYFAHYADTAYEFSKITNGSRVLLRYSLHFRGQTKPTASVVRDSMSDLKWSLENLRPFDRMVMVPLKKDYKASSLVNSGVNALAYSHRVDAEAIRAAAKDWALLLVNAEVKQTTTSQGYSGANSTTNKVTRIFSIFSEQGVNVSRTFKWLEDVIDFGAVSSQDEDDGMLLTCLNEDTSLTDDWGNCKRNIYRTTGGYDSYDSDPSYFQEFSRTTKKAYRSTFLLAYCLSAEPELKCLSGCEASASVAETIRATRDYSLLDRLLSVVETKPNSELDSRSCHMLLQMLTRSTSQDSMSNRRIAYANRIIAGLSPSLEPCAELYDMIIASVDKFGHSQLSGSISLLLNDEERKGNHDIRVFLRRANFCLNLNSRLGGDNPEYLVYCIEDLHSHGKPSVSNNNGISESILSMLKQHGVEAMGDVVKAALTFMNKASSAFEALVKHSILLEELERLTQYDFMDECLVGFASAFVKGLDAYRYTGRVEAFLNGEAKQVFVKAVRYVMKNGCEDVLSEFGVWARRSEDQLSAFFNAIEEEANHKELILGILNKCLVIGKIRQIDDYNWPTYKDAEGNVPPSSHVRKVLEKYPTLASKSDGDGRLALHHAAESSTAPFEAVMDVFESNPNAASIRDPLSGLYPFQLAAAAENDAAFSLLLANPSVVSSGVQDDTTGKKRKRSLSME